MPEVLAMVTSADVGPIALALNLNAFSCKRLVEGEMVSSCLKSKCLRPEHTASPLPFTELNQ